MDDGGKRSRSNGGTELGLIMVRLSPGTYSRVRT